MATTWGKQQSIQNKTKAHNQNVNIGVADIADNNSDNEECFDEDKEDNWPVLHADDEDIKNKPTGTKSISANELCVEKDDERESNAGRRTSLHADVKGVYIYIKTKKNENDDEIYNPGENVPFQGVSKDSLRESKKNIHDGILNIEDIIKKMKQNKKDKVKDKKKTQHFCQFCGIVYKSYKSCVKHEQKHINQKVITKLKKTRTEKRDFMCMYCGHTFATNLACEEHERIHTGERPYKCQFCDKSFYMARSKVRHENIHTNEKVYLCYFCGKIFNSRSSKAEHETIHTGEKPYKCQFCQKAFRNRCDVKVHERIHTGVKPYKCQFCEKSFKQKNKRKSHERVHTGERPYKCRYCEKAFSHNVNRRLHEKKHSSQNLLLVQERTHSSKIHSKMILRFLKIRMHYRRRVDSRVITDKATVQFSVFLNLRSEEEDVKPVVDPIGVLEAQETIPNNICERPVKKPRRGRASVFTLEEQKEKKKIANKERHRRTIFLGKQVERWEALKEELQPKSNEHLAKHLIDTYHKYVKLVSQQNTEADCADDLLNSKQPSRRRKNASPRRLNSVSSVHSGGKQASELDNLKSQTKAEDKSYVFGYSDEKLPMANTPGAFLNLGGKTEGKTTEIKGEKDKVGFSSLNQCQSFDDGKVSDLEEFNNDDAELADDDDSETSSDESDNEQEDDDDDDVYEPGDDDYEPGTYKCEFCGKQIPRSSFARHKKTHKNDGNLQCKVCGCYFTTKEELKNHEHKKEVAHVCQFCGKLFKQYFMCVKHEREHKQSEVVEKEVEKPFTCETCGRCFQLIGHLRHHQRSHRVKDLFQCQYCIKTYKNKDCLVVHERTHTGENPFVCQHCGKGFAQKIRCQQHERSHTGERPYKCRYCEKTFATLNVRYFHEKTHSGEKPHHCKICFKGFTLKRQCRRHELIHTGEKPFKCGYCEKTFVQKGACVSHERVHTGVKPYKCRFCSQGFSHNVSRKSHEKTHTATGQMATKEKAAQRKSCASAGQTVSAESMMQENNCTQVGELPLAERMPQRPGLSGPSAGQFMTLDRMTHGNGHSAVGQVMPLDRMTHENTQLSLGQPGSVERTMYQYYGM
ncbi:zinc finger protein 91 [Lingula anatina]|uniref:Zinc finger protein 91 n=1 Tax=Lingula anatina TaxID=7574 RepID=A0A1S3HAD6_LINAN|nr:zinc finger protein 91 [Lingula anatina]|eukprot:XP_013382973.1 zinc finger protein 91 [Lingula anatina]